MAMRQGDRFRTNGTNDNHHHDRARTPDSTSSSRLKRTPASLNLAGGSASFTSTSRSWGNSSTRKAPDQPTLTQIDFVTVSQNVGLDDELDYIGAPCNPPEVIEVNDDDDDADYLPTRPSRTSRVRGVRFGPTPTADTLSKPRRPDGEVKRGRRKSSDRVKSHGKDKGIQKKDKTLTQMDYVRRYLPLESDDDVKLEYTYVTSKKKEPLPQPDTILKHEDMEMNQTLKSEVPSQRKRRKLTPTLDSNDMDRDGEEQGISPPPPPPPVTPRKTARPEIPSSQSPESPGIAFISSSQFRGATQSPGVRASKALSELYVKEESLELGDSDGAHETSRRTVLFRSSASSPHDISDCPAPVPQVLNRPSSPGLSGSLTTRADGSHDSHSEHPATTQRTVIYETDADTDYDEFQDDLPDTLSSREEHENLKHNNQPADGEDNSSSSILDSQELPPLPLSEPDAGSGPLPSENHLESDISICYQRLQPATQFPLEPIPTINTQKMAELFPESSTTMQPMASPRQVSSMNGHHPSHDERGLQTQNQTQSQSRSQSISEYQAEKTPDVVLESSPITRHADSGPHGRVAVVQVESSQPVDKLPLPGIAGPDSGPRGILSRSQILTSSVME
ncbi:hypothetical protein AOCH_002149, partial [Aspergillus ochraceoroseus]